MIKLDAALLKSLGLFGLPSNVANIALRVIYAGLEARVGLKLADAMSDDQLDEFEEFIEAGDEDAALHWLEQAFPDYPAVVDRELQAICLGIGLTAPQVRMLLSGRAG